MHILITGNPVDGFVYYGPYPTAEEASFAGATHPEIDADWWIAPLNALALS